MLNHRLPPVIILGGDHGCLSIARSLGAAGIRVYALNYPESIIKYSRFCKWIDRPLSDSIGVEAWKTYLLGQESDYLRDAVLLAASDEAIELILKHRQALSERFTLDISNPDAQLCMLDKLCTYRIAQAAGVPTPKFWVANSREQILELERELVFPLILKPIVGHKFSRKFKGHYAVTYSLDELLKAFETVCSAGVATFLVEMIPGPDDRLCSYYTYLDENGKSLLNFTKRVIRRYPLNMGGSTYHITDDVPYVRQLALALFHQAGLRGVANAEFKMDVRDGKLKLIECNARFTAADCLLVASGLNLPLFVYDRLTGRPHQEPSSYRVGMRLWKPVGDFAAYRQLSKMGSLTFWAWIASIMHRQIFPVFRWNDPLPSIFGSASLIRHAWSRFFSMLSTKKSAAPLHLSGLPQPLTSPMIQSGVRSQIEPASELPQE